MHHARGAEVAGEFFVVGHVVAVREEDGADAAERFDLADERAREARRIDEDVAALRVGADDRDSSTPPKLVSDVKPQK